MFLPKTMKVDLKILILHLDVVNAVNKTEIDILQEVPKTSFLRLFLCNFPTDLLLFFIPWLLKFILPRAKIVKKKLDWINIFLYFLLAHLLFFFPKKPNLILMFLYLLLYLLF